MEKQVLATVGSREITNHELDIALKHAPREHAMQLNNPEGKKYLLNEMILQEMLYLDAKEKQFDKDEEFLRELDVIQTNLLKQYAVKKLIENITVDSHEAKEYYDQNREQFVTGETARAKHILLKDEDRAKEILTEIQAGKSFEEMAQIHSECPSKAQGGDLGYFEKGKMVPEFEEVAFGLENGEISQLVKTQFGYHIIKLEDKKSADVMAFEQVEKQIEDYLLRNKQNHIYVTYTNELKNKYPVSINPEGLK